MSDLMQQAQTAVRNYSATLEDTTRYFRFTAVDKDEYKFYNSNERKWIAQLKQIIEYYEDRETGYGANVARLLDALEYALEWLLDYSMADISEEYLAAITEHRNWWRSNESRSQRAQARLKALEWIVEELEELSEPNLWKYAV